jgi:hypothetical protein
MERAFRLWGIDAPESSQLCRGEDSLQYADPSGMNLRNEIAHGLMDSNQFYWHLGNLIVHSLLILGLWKEFAERRKN